MKIYALVNYHFEKHGGLLFLLNCDYSVKNLDSRIPLFYQELLEYFQELHSSYEDPLKRKFILWDNKEINIENKSVFWKAWWDKNVLFIQDLLNNQGNYLFLHQKNSMRNITSRLTFCSITKLLQPFPPISKATHQFIRILGTETQLVKTSISNYLMMLL